MDNLFAKIAGIWVVVFIVGYIIGTANSPDFSKKAYVEDYIEKNAQIADFSVNENQKKSASVVLKGVQVVDAKSYIPVTIGTVSQKPGLTAIKRDTTKSKVVKFNPSILGTAVIGVSVATSHFSDDILFNAGRYLYIYHSKDETINRINNTTYQLGNHTKQLAMGDYEKIFAVAGISSLYKLEHVKSVFTSSKNSVIVTALGVLLAGGCGYELGHDTDDFDPDSEMAQKVLHDPLFWKSIKERAD